MPTQDGARRAVPPQAESDQIDHRGPDRHHHRRLHRPRHHLEPAVRAAPGTPGPKPVHVRISAPRSWRPATWASTWRPARNSSAPRKTSTDLRGDRCRLAVVPLHRRRRRLRWETSEVDLCLGCVTGEKYPYEIEGRRPTETSSGPVIGGGEVSADGWRLVPNAHVRPAGRAVKCEILSGPSPFFRSHEPRTRAGVTDRPRRRRTRSGRSRSRSPRRRTSPEYWASSGSIWATRSWSGPTWASTCWEC